MGGNGWTFSVALRAIQERNVKHGKKGARSIRRAGISLGGDHVRKRIRLEKERDATTTYWRKRKSPSIVVGDRMKKLERRGSVG